MKLRFSTVCKWLILFMPVWSFAANKALQFTPPDTDISLRYLQDIFGVVPGVLHGTGSQIMGVMFGVFNSACLSLAGIIATYSLVISTIATAKDGEMLGSKMSEIWAPMRAAAGVAMLLPKVSGYSFIQILVMWIVVQGIGAADSIWNVTLQYLQNGGTIIQASFQPSLSAINNAEKNVKNLFKDMVCLYALQDALNAQYTSNVAAPVNVATGGVRQIYGSSGATVPLFSETINPLSKAVGGGGLITMNIPDLSELPNDNPYKKFDAACGSISWKQTTANSAYSTSNAGDSGTITLNDARTIALGQLINSVGMSARKAVSNAQLPKDQQLLLGYCPAGSGCGFTNWTQIDGLQKPYVLSGSELQQAFADYMAIIQPALRMQSGDLTDGARNSGWVADAKARGWIMAGSYYFNLAAFNSGIRMQADNSLPDVKLPSPGGNDVGLLGPSFGLCAMGGQAGVSPYNTMSTSVCKDFTNWSFCYRCNGVPSGFPAPILRDEIAEFGRTTSSSYYHVYGTADVTAGYEATGIAVGGDASFVAGAILGPLGFIGTRLSQLLNTERTNENPLILLVYLGSDLMNMAAIGFLIAGIGSILTALIGLIPCVTVSAGMLSLFSIMAPLVTGIMISMLGAGAVLAYYIPMIPFIIFTFSAIGWFITVIESMVAAPVVALGLMHPEGQHDVLGKSDSAIMLLTNVFLRPSMMVIGFISGISLSYVGVWLLNQGFGQALSTMMGSVSGFTRAFAGPFVAVVYANMVMAMMTKTFSLIHVVPDKVLRWLSGGIQEQLGSESVNEALNSAKSGVNEVGGDISSAAKESSGDMMKRGERQGQKNRSDKIEDGKKSAHASNMKAAREEKK